MAVPGGSEQPVTGIVQSGTGGQQLGGNAEHRTSQMVICNPLQSDSVLFCRLRALF